MLGEEIGGVGHALHAAGDDDVGAAGPNRVGGHDRRLHAGAAHLVDRGRLDMAGKSGLQRRLPRRGLAEAGGEDAAHVDLLDRLVGDAGALDRRADRGGAELGGAGAGEGALEAAHRGAGVGEDDDGIGVGHFVLSFVIPAQAGIHASRYGPQPSLGRRYWVEAGGAHKSRCLPLQMVRRSRPGLRRSAARLRCGLCVTLAQ